MQHITYDLSVITQIYKKELTRSRVKVVFFQPQRRQFMGEINPLTNKPHPTAMAMLNRVPARKYSVSLRLSFPKRMIDLAPYYLLLQNKVVLDDFNEVDGGENHRIQNGSFGLCMDDSSGSADDDSSHIA